MIRAGSLRLAMLRKPTRLHHSALLIALGAMMLRALIPAGYMPNWSGGHAKAWLAICHAGALQVLVEPARRASGEPIKPTDSSRFECPYAALAAPGLAPATWSVSTPPRPLPAVLTSLTSLVSAEQPRRPPARAPPRHSVFR